MVSLLLQLFCMRSIQNVFLPVGAEAVSKLERLPSPVLVSFLCLGLQWHRCSALAPSGCWFYWKGLRVEERTELWNFPLRNQCGEVLLC